jgi:hypothetical protein
MLEIITPNIQLGFDIATSVTILVAAISWSLENRRNSKELQKNGIIEHARSTTLTKTLSIVEEFEDSFSGIVKSSQKCINGVQTGLKGQEAADELVLRIENNSLSIPKKIIEIDAFLSMTEEYYETIQKRRYSLLPILETLDENGDFRISIKESIVELGDLIKSARWENLLMLSWLQDMSEHIINKNNETNHTDPTQFEVDTSLFNTANEFILNEDFSHFTRQCLHGEVKDEYTKMIDGKLKLNKSLIMEVISQFLGELVAGHQHLRASALLNLCSDIMSVRVASKSILIKLSSLAYVLLSRSSQSGVMSVVEKFESEEYFSKELHVR